MRPYQTPPPGVMSQDEQRYWLTELLERRGWGYNVLARTLGCRGDLNRKRRGKEWFYPTEQVRFSHQLQRIISGELVCVPGKAKCGPNGKKRAVIADHPVPLAPPTKLVYDMKAKGLRAVPTRELGPALPSFGTLLNDVPTSRCRAVDYRGSRRS